MSKVTLLTSDQGRFEIDEVVAKKSHMLRNIIEDTGSEEEIYLPNVKSAPLHKIISYCDHYRSSDPPEIEKPLSKPSLKELVSAWDEQFVDIKNQEELLELLLAANYLDVRSLIELCCAKVATLIKGTFKLIQAKLPKKSGRLSASPTTSPLRKRRRSASKTSGLMNAPE